MQRFLKSVPRAIPSHIGPMNNLFLREMDSCSDLYAALLSDGLKIHFCEPSSSYETMAWDREAVFQRV